MNQPTAEKWQLNYWFNWITTKY